MLAELAAAEPAIQIELLASNALDNLLRREADIAVRMVRPLQASLVARKLAELPMLKIPPLPCWLAVHREIRGSRVVRRVYDFLAEAIPRALAR